MASVLEATQKRVVNTMIPISMMAQLFTGFFQFYTSFNHNMSIDYSCVLTHSNIVLRYGVHMSGLGLETNITEVVNTMIPISVMAQLFNSLVPVSFLFRS